MNMGTTEIVLLVILAFVLFGGSMMVDVVGRMLIKNMKEIRTDGKEDGDGPDGQDENGNKA